MPDECSQDNGSDSDPSRRSTLDEQANENEQLPPGAHRFTQTNFGRSKCLEMYCHKSRRVTDDLIAIECKVCDGKLEDQVSFCEGK